MESRNILSNLQKKYKEGGYALISPKTGKVSLFEDDIKKLYKVIEQKNIKDSDKVVMFVPPPHVKHVFQISLPVRFS